MLRVVGRQWSRDGAAFSVVRDVEGWWRGRWPIKLGERVWEERVLTVCGVGDGWRRRLGECGWIGSVWDGRIEQSRRGRRKLYNLPNALTALLRRRSTQQFERVSGRSRIELHGAAWRSSPRTGCRPTVTGRPAVSSAIKVSRRGAEHAGLKLRGWWWGWWWGWSSRDGRTAGGGQDSLLPLLLAKRSQFSATEFELAFGVGVGCLAVELGVWVWRRLGGRALAGSCLDSSCACMCWGCGGKDVGELLAEICGEAEKGVGIGSGVD